MMLLADESVATVIIDQLRNDGHAILSIRESTPGAPDTQVLAEADTGRQLLLTEDKDFGEMVYRQGASHHGVVLIRLAGVSRSGRAALVSTALKDHAAELLGAFTVISRGGIRIRPSAAPQSEPPS